MVTPWPWVLSDGLAPEGDVVLVLDEQHIRRPLPSSGCQRFGTPKTVA
jgi:hypothetical protein